MDRIGFAQKEFSVKSNYRRDLNQILILMLTIMNDNISLNVFLRIIDSEYISKRTELKKVEFVPNYNIKTGIKLGIGNVLSIAMYQPNSLTRQMLKKEI